MNATIKRTVLTLAVCAALSPFGAQADSGDPWEFSVSIYGWFPDISGTTAFGEDIGVDIDDILDNLDFTFQGTFDARKGRWGVITDVIYLDLGDTTEVTQESTLGRRIEVPADVTGTAGFDMKSWIWEAAGYYRLIDEQSRSFDLLAGFRYTDIDQSLSWDLEGDVGQLPLPGRQGTLKVSEDFWDFVVGVRGQFDFGRENAWFVPYYFDVGTGDSDLTWQGLAGVGYRFGWGSVAAAWRYLDYDMSGGRALQDVNFSGPEVGVVIPF